MNKPIPVEINNSWIIQQRGEKNSVNPLLPYSFHVEKEYIRKNYVADVGTIFLTNKECPFHCLMCDLWKNTTDFTVPAGAIPAQIDHALSVLPKTNHLKLYNSGNFFDPKAIPVSDYHDIAALTSGFETLIVECHPKLINRRCLDFQQLIEPKLQVAMGLETIHPKILSLLNKQMTLNDFKNSVHFLNVHHIDSRAFILLGLPYLSEKESIQWTKAAIEFAFEIGVECCVIIPTRTGNGAMDSSLPRKNIHKIQHSIPGRSVGIWHWVECRPRICRPLGFKAFFDL